MAIPAIEPHDDHGDPGRAERVEQYVTPAYSSRRASIAEPDRVSG
jgi:hypothetical protein